MISNYIFQPGVQPTGEKDAARRKKADEVKAHVDRVEERMLSLDNSKFDKDDAKDVVDLSGGVILDRTVYRGTYNKGEMRVSSSYYVGPNNIQPLFSVDVKKNNFGYDRVLKQHFGLDKGWSSYDDIRGGLVNVSEGGFQYIPV